jgi:Chlamydia polymorphic membrane protein (Chlamydia_PMP) repeat
VTNCKFSSNSAGQYGGGIYNMYKGSTVTNCAFINNTAGQGGGICNSYANSPSTAVTNCIFTGNAALTYGQGGGILNINASGWSVTNCTFTGNTAGSVGGMYSSDTGSRLLTMTNSILWGNSSPEIYIANSSNLSITYCDIKMTSGTYPGTGNIININSCFI